MVAPYIQPPYVDVIKSSSQHRYLNENGAAFIFTNNYAVRIALDPTHEETVSATDIEAVNFNAI
jgi:hypothetical protein